MNRGWLGRTVFMVMAFWVVSCTANLQVRKQQGEASRNLGEAYFKQGDYTAALREFLKAEALYPDDSFLQNDLGLAYKAKKKPDLAIKHFKKALKIKPNYARAKNNLGTVYLDKKEWDTAIEYFKEITEDLLYTTPHFAFSNLGWAYYNKKAYALAEKFYLKALEVKPKFVSAMVGLGTTYIAMGRSSDAVATLEKAVKNYPRFGQLYFELAKAYVLSGKYKKALDAYKKAIKFAPDNTLAREAEREAQKIKTFRK